MASELVETIDSSPSAVRFEIPYFTYVMGVLFGTKVVVFGSIWTVDERNGKLYLRWSIAEKFYKLFAFPMELARKSFLGGPKMSASGRGYKYEMEISSYTIFNDNNEFEFVGSLPCKEGSQKIYFVNTFLKNCKRPFVCGCLIEKYQHMNTNHVVGPTGMDETQ